MHHIPGQLRSDYSDMAAGFVVHGCFISAGPICGELPASTKCSTVPAQHLYFDEALRSDSFAAKWLGPRPMEGRRWYIIAGFGPDGVSARLCLKGPACGCGCKPAISIIRLRDVIGVRD